MPLSKKRTHLLHLRLVNSERAKRRREELTSHVLPCTLLPHAIQKHYGRKEDSDTESESESDFEEEEPQDGGEDDWAGGLEGCEDFINESNVMEEEDLKGKRELKLQWSEGAGASLPAGVHGGPVGRTAQWKREKKRQQLAVEGEKSYRITDMWKRQKELGISIRDTRDSERGELTEQTLNPAEEEEIETEASQQAHS